MILNELVGFKLLLSSTFSIDLLDALILSDKMYVYMHEIIQI